MVNGRLPALWFFRNMCMLCVVIYLAMTCYRSYNGVGRGPRSLIRGAWRIHHYTYPLMVVVLGLVVVAAVSALSFLS